MTIELMYSFIKGKRKNNKLQFKDVESAHTIIDILSKRSLYFSYDLIIEEMVNGKLHHTVESNIVKR